MHKIESLTELMKSLRDPDRGCPWDIRQTSASIAKYTLEETHEVLDAIERGDKDNLKEELGDLLFHIVFHSRIAEENGEFDFNDVIESIVEKMTRRHPHVFGDDQQRKLSEADIAGLWTKIKQEEKLNKPEPGFAACSRDSSALFRAEQIQYEAAEYGFDWPDIYPVIDKLVEELGELRETIEANDLDAIEDELGDLIFVCVNIGRHRKLNAEMALRRTNQKFIRRFEYVIEQMKANSQVMNQQQLEQMERFWQASKAVVG